MKIAQYHLRVNQSFDSEIVLKKPPQKDIYIICRAD